MTTAIMWLRRYRETVPNANVVLLAGEPGHYPHVESPKLVLEAYFAFLQHQGYGLCGNNRGANASQ